MTLQVIGAGFGRTGTMSTRAALNRLGLPCYHMTEVALNLRNLGHLGFWLRVARTPQGTPHDWQRVFRRYCASVDFPGATVWRDLMTAYPDAKILLTLHPRGAEGWYDSAMATIYFAESLWQWRVIEAVLPFGRRFGRMQRELVWARALRGTMPDRTHAVARYEAHVADVMATVPPERLVVFTVTDGWGPLCDALGLPVPDVPFPRINDRKQFRWVHRLVTLGAWAIIGAAGLLLAVGAYGLTRLI